MDTLGNRIKKVRKKLNLTQREFAESLGITQANISAIENNTYNPSIPMVKLICLKYKVSETWLLEGKGNMNFFPPEWSVTNINGLLQKLDAMKILFDNNIDKIQSDKDILFNIVESFAFFVSITSPAKLDEENKKAYFNQLYDLFDKLEKYIFKCSIIERKKQFNYEDLYHLKEKETELKESIVNIINNISNIFICNAYPDFIK